MFIGVKAYPGKDLGCFFAYSKSYLEQEHQVISYRYLQVTTSDEGD
jgi:hypothetical protein